MEEKLDSIAKEFSCLDQVQRKYWISHHFYWPRRPDCHIAESERRMVTSIHAPSSCKMHKTREKTYTHPLTGEVKSSRYVSTFPLFKNNFFVVLLRYAYPQDGVFFLHGPNGRDRFEFCPRMMMDILKQGRLKIQKILAEVWEQRVKNPEFPIFFKFIHRK